MSRSRRPRIVLARNMFANVGDEAMLVRELLRLRERFPDAKVRIATDAPEEVSGRHGVCTVPSEAVLGSPVRPDRTRTWAGALADQRELPTAVRRSRRALVEPAARLYLAASCRRFVWNARRMARGRRLLGLPRRHRTLLETIASADVLFGGGGLIPSLPRLFLPKEALYRAAGALGIPIVLHGQTVLPDRRAAAALRTARAVVLRDEQLSRENALAMGLEPERLVDGVDPAHGLDPASWGSVRERLAPAEQAPRESGRYVAVNVRGWKGRDLRRGYGAVASALEGYVGERPGVAVVLFGMQRYHQDDDERALAVLRAHLGALRTCTLRAATGSGRSAPDPRLVKGLVGHARSVITCRYHGAVFALEQAVPAIGLSVGPEYDVKLTGVYRRYGAEAWLGSLREPDAGWIERTLARVDRDREEVAGRLRSAAGALDRLGDVGYDELERLLGGPRGEAGGRTHDR